MEIIILAGGLGTRLGQYLGDNPKPMVIINGKPFLYYLFEYLIRNNVKKVILSVHFKHEKIIDYFGDEYKEIKILYSIDKSKLGTGGAIKNALTFVKNKNAIIINGDTYYDVKLQELIKFHKKNKNDITLAIKPKNNFRRYGHVILDQENNVLKFTKKQFQSFGYIDGGIFCLNKNLFKHSSKKIFSINKFISQNINSLNIKAIKFDNKFIDIGTPKDLKEATEFFK